MWPRTPQRPGQLGAQILDPVLCGLLEAPYPLQQSLAFLGQQFLARVQTVRGLEQGDVRGP
ncbi:hypothetical protein ACFYO2_42530 [Streptomyces sp. NPDC006602]|uniref:hypothetical protein n=1 Tax=Streptomyces sp. NPDC006602 TaxID=3364751 RepID=UPI0036A393F3